MALEAIKSIKNAEQQATENINKAIEGSKDILKKSEIESVGQYKKVLDAAKEEIKKIIESAKEEGRINSEPILEQGKADIDNILNLDSERFHRAVNKVVERIVKNNGNS
ncbi:ATPase [Clostridium bowmanii]|uniref:ATPase n=1 Tax=Clostridium bowmanii TaxID=132925 RepID=UPI001C0DF7CC|nr:ATPase [Clostridium bowmanii]MBU3189440.1 ATPase [Clostridium bowmanii]MCA1074055.1 ATPase [Clostridium bowmanii]